MAIIAGNYGLRACFMLVLLGKGSQSSQLSLSRCPILHAQWKQLIQTNIHHLCRMSGQFPLQCISETTDFRFPLEAHRGIKSDSGIVIYEILQHIFYFISKDHPNNIWNSTCIDNLRNSLHQQIEQLETCCSATEMQNGLKTCDNVGSYPLTLKFKRYFQRMNNFLNSNQQSQCAWETIFLEMKGCLLFITQILNELK
ncbi:interferon tau-2-like [Elgaria multicarinata webbii]|uniref:interferon tau-2-like n=1 Tax=Elgaria multicarinata webbii TaxID=159646 RepID=UPI002FCD585B